MAKREATKTDAVVLDAERLEDDADVGVARARRARAQAERDEARAAVRTLLPDDGRMPVTIRFLLAQEKFREAEAALEACDRETEAAERAARQRIAEARRPGLVALDRDVLDAAEDLRERIAARSAYAAETAAKLGRAVGPSAAAALRGPLEAAVAGIRREMDPPGEVPTPGPRDGERRCRVLVTSLWDHSIPTVYERGRVVDLPDAEVDRLAGLEPPAVELVVV